jgi:hypothetical protein
LNIQSDLNQKLLDGKKNNFIFNFLIIKGHEHQHDEHSHDSHSHSHSHSHDHSHHHGHGHGDSHENLNLNAAFVHIIGDAVQNIGVVIY